MNRYTFYARVIRALISSALAASAAIMAKSASANLIFNPGFDLAGSLASNSNNSITSATIPGWILNGLGGTPGGTAQVTTSTPTFGTGANFARVFWNANIQTSASDRPAVSPGQELAYSFDVYGNSDRAFRDMVFLRWYDATDQFISSTNLMPSNVTQFTTTTLSGTTLVPANAATVGFSFNGTVSPIREMYADNFSLTVIPEVSAPSDGSWAYSLWPRSRGDLPGDRLFKSHRLSISEGASFDAHL